MGYADSDADVQTLHGALDKIKEMASNFIYEKNVTNRVLSEDNQRLNKLLREAETALTAAREREEKAVAVCEALRQNWDAAFQGQALTNWKNVEAAWAAYDSSRAADGKEGA